MTRLPKVKGVYAEVTLKRDIRYQTSESRDSMQHKQPLEMDELAERSFGAESMFSKSAAGPVKVRRKRNKSPNSSGVRGASPTGSESSALSPGKSRRGQPFPTPKMTNLTAKEEFERELEEIRWLKGILRERYIRETKVKLEEGNAAAVNIQRIVRGKLAKRSNQTHDPSQKVPTIPLPSKTESSSCEQHSSRSTARSTSSYFEKKRLEIDKLEAEKRNALAELRQLEMEKVKAFEEMKQKRNNEMKELEALKRELELMKSVENQSRQSPLNEVALTPRQKDPSSTSQRAGPTPQSVEENYKQQTEIRPETDMKTLGNSKTSFKKSALGNSSGKPNQQEEAEKENAAFETLRVSDSRTKVDSKSRIAAGSPAPSIVSELPVSPSAHSVLESKDLENVVGFVQERIIEVGEKEHSSPLVPKSNEGESFEPIEDDYEDDFSEIGTNRSWDKTKEIGSTEPSLTPKPKSSQVPKLDIKTKVKSYDSEVEEEEVKENFNVAQEVEDDDSDSIPEIPAIEPTKGATDTSEDQEKGPKSVIEQQKELLSQFKKNGGRNIAEPDEDSDDDGGLDDLIQLANATKESRIREQEEKLQDEDLAEAATSGNIPSPETEENFLWSKATPKQSKQPLSTLTITDNPSSSSPISLKKKENPAIAATALDHAVDYDDDFEVDDVEELDL